MSADDLADRKARLAARRERLSGAQQASLRERLRGQGARGEAAPARCLVELTPAAGARPAFHCLHPAGGDVLAFVPLARELGPERPFRAVRSLGLEEGEEPLASFEEMAGRYLQEIRAAQPQGPYLVGGWSLGGVVAFELARQFEAQGQEVALLAIFDAGPSIPAEEAGGEEGDVPWLLGIAEYVERLWGASLGITAALLTGLSSEQQADLFVERMRSAGLSHSATASRAQLARLLRAYKSNVRALRSYRPSRYGGRLTLFRARDEAGEAGLPPDLGWAELAAGGVEVRWTPGDHHTLMAEPNVALLARELSVCLARATEPRSPIAPERR